MLSRRRLLWGAMGALGCLSGANAMAHRMNVAMSVIEVNPNSKRLEITHSLYAHDLEGALGAGSVNLTWFETSQGEAALRAYCLAQFSIASSNGRAIALRFVGVELRGDLINIYFEGPRVQGNALLVQSSFLQEMSDSQINQVNVRAAGRTNSAIFQTGARAKQIVIPQ
jgi:hypothetical protein